MFNSVRLATPSHSEQIGKDAARHDGEWFILTQRLVNIARRQAALRDGIGKVLGVWRVALPTRIDVTPGRGVGRVDEKRGVVDG